MTDAYLCDFVRSPIGRYGGALAGVRADDLAAHPLRELCRRHPALAERVEEVWLGCANQAGEDNRNVARMALLLAGMDPSVPGVTINRLCASGMEAVGTAVRAIRSGEISLAIAGGVESMSRAPFVMGKAEIPFQRAAGIHDTTLGWRFVNPRFQGRYGIDSMAETGENVAGEYGISREDQDAFAWRSQQRTARAREGGLLGEPIIPVETAIGKGGVRRVEEDEHPRPGTTPEGLAGLQPIVRPGGTVTAGNASGINDGSAAMVVASGDAAERWGLTPRARVLGMAAAGVPPRVMGMGPVAAVGKLLGRLGLKIEEIDVIELNEAFASQALACLREWGIPDDAGHVNANGGAIALGHPLGMSGARIVGAAVQELGRRGGRYAVATLCVGVGQGVALALERVG